MQRDGYAKSLWQTTVEDYVPRTTAVPTEVDVVVAGGGITGLTTALLLQQAGLSCFLAEARSIGFGSTGGTSAHINTLLELSYDRMISKFGLEASRTVAQGVREAYDLIRDLAGAHAPDCGWSEREAFLYATTDEQAKELDAILNGTVEVGMPAEYTDRIPLAVPFVKAVRFPGQAQFHPTRYLCGLATAFEAMGGDLLHQCRVLDAQEEDGRLSVTTERGTVRARYLVHATHVPPGVNVLHFRNAPYRSYLLAATLSDPARMPTALVYDMEDPYHYYRSQEVDGRMLLVAGGCDHKTGEEDNTPQRLRELEAQVRRIFPVESITHRWSSQYFEPTDGLPYIGKLPMGGGRIHVATGFNGNGMPLGTLSGIVLTGLLAHGESPYAAVFDPGRISVVAGFTNFVKEAADVIGHLVAAPFPAKRLNDLADMAPGEGRVVQHEGRSVALHRDEDGALHAVDPACSHIKCTVAWNASERSWDCPCHGSRFAADGAVLTAPARKPLQRITITDAPA